MKGDFTRSTFVKQKHYSSVRLQQGRVQLDADWNEHVDILEHLGRTEAIDVIGKCGVPKTGGGFQIAPSGDGSGLRISAGRIYVGGILCENEAEMDFTAQADNPGAAVPEGAGVYLAYLDVWERHITALEDPDIREVALNGPDTATRTQVIRQVKLEKVGNLGDTVACEQFDPAWQPAGTASTGRLRARAVPDPAVTDPCIIPQAAGYRRLENQLYRVEIHTPGAAGTATFKWSRDNGMIAARVEGIVDKDITVSGAGRDRVLAFAAGQFVELSDEQRTLNGRPGVFVELEKVEGTKLTVKAWPGGSPPPLEDKPTVRRWDSPGEVALTTGGYIDLEDGIQVEFQDGAYQTGDYWLIPARTVRGDVLWPKNGSGDPAFQARQGIVHHYCPLALVRFESDGFALLPDGDCRPHFPPLTHICAEDVCFDPAHCAEEHAVPGWAEVETVQQALDKICENLGVSGRCHDFLDDLRADGVVRDADGALGFEVSLTDNPLEIAHTGGVAYVAGCRFEIPAGSVEANPSTTHQTLLVDPQGNVQLATKGPFPEKYALLAHISTFQGQVIRIVDARCDLTHLDDRVKENFARTSQARIDRRQFVPLLAYSIKGLEYRDGRNRIFELNPNSRFNGIPYGQVSDGENIWVCSFDGPNVAKIPMDASSMASAKLIPLGIEKPGAWGAAFDGVHVWFTLMNDGRVARLHAETNEVNLIPVGATPTGIAFDGDFIWVCNTTGRSLSVIDIDSLRVVRTLSLLGANGQETNPIALAFDGSHMWIASTTNHLFRVEKPWGDPELVYEELPRNSRWMAFDGSHMWIASRNGNLHKADVTTRSISAVVDELPSIHTIAFDGAYMWVSHLEGEFAIFSKIDVSADRVIGQMRIRGRPFFSSFDGTHLWISTAENVQKHLIS